MNHQEFLLSTFREEIDGHIVTLTRTFVELEEVSVGAAQTEKLREIMRVLHTVKGASRMLGFAPISRVAHVMEDLVGVYRNAQPPLEIPRNIIDVWFEALDVISEMTRESTRSGNAPAEPNPLTEPEFVDLLVNKMLALTGTPESQAELEATTHSNQLDETFNPNPKSTAVSASKAVEIASPTMPVQSSTPEVINPDNADSLTERLEDETVRVRLNKLDELINLSGELIIDKQQNQEHLQALSELMRDMRTHTRLVQQLRDYIIERTPIEERNRLLGITELFSFEQPQAPEWLKANAESSTNSSFRAIQTTNGNGRETISKEAFGLDGHSLKTLFGKFEEMATFSQKVEQRLSTVLRERKTYNLRFDNAADELRRNMMGIRMLPLETLFGRFARPMRDLAYGLGKEVKFVITGGNIEVDKRILEQIADPLIHILRNAVDHGIEMPPERMAHSKPLEGTIKLAALQKGSHVLIQVTDDGGGIDPNFIRQTAVAKGLIDEAMAKSLNDVAVLDLIYRPGFSTRARPDEISGRGIGMDVVQQNIKRLNGRILVESERQVGTTFTMEIPLTLATIDALIIRTSGQLFAMPSVMVAGTVRENRQGLFTVEGRPALKMQGQIIPIIKLSEILALPNLENSHKLSDFETDDENMLYGILLNSGASSLQSTETNERLICFEVDGLIDEREVVVKGLGAFLEKIPNIAGITVLGADGLALILDVFSLAQYTRTGNINPTIGYTPATPKLLARKIPRILVVDDSLATRELERSILETAGFEVETARDGLEALQSCQERRPDLVLSDIEMPNMDGFRLSAALRADAQLADLPVIIVSSRDSEEDRRKGMAAGAQAYIVKGQFEQNQLLETISRLIN